MEAGPFSSTSFQTSLRPFSMPMWLGTVSSTSPIPCFFRVAASAARSSSVPSSGLSCDWFTTS